MSDAMLMRTTLYAAAARGDLEAIRSFPQHPAVQTSVSETNRTLSAAYEAALAVQMDPFVGQLRGITPPWYGQSVSGYSEYHEVLFAEPAKQGHVHVFEWFFGAEAYAIVGETIRSLLNGIYWRVLWAEDFSAELTETILSSHLFQSMSSIEQEFAMSMMLGNAINSADPAIIRLLVAHGGSLEPAVALVGCAEKGDGLTAEILLDCGVFGVEHLILDRFTYFATVDVAEVFVKNGMDVQSGPGEFGPLQTAAYEGVLQLVEFFVTQGFADVNAQCSRGLTPLMATLTKNEAGLGAFREEPPLIVAFLLENGALVNLRDVSSRTVLHLAAKSKYEGLVRLLLEHGADPNAQDLYRDTPLHMAARSTYCEDFTARLDALFSFGADPCVCDSDGQTPLDILLETKEGCAYVMSHRQLLEHLEGLTVETSA
ncbi:hypothetical protein Poli38472_009352 [Pythium oligandrum]|uniref:Ankyrin repeat protein n=1 Tax=Pythium oligandrum TaxID=41045 RepID=A0A8K1CKZ6_PYTOL|nr:hypothetical protein Poli38472_009352 [Pythium oligandrum]|eukprot:TMW65185.1 hypothetical protein Poli38472_009352 [Pythium oligandrum]